MIFFFFSAPCRPITPHFFHFQASPRSACVGQIVFQRALEAIWWLWPDFKNVHNSRVAPPTDAHSKSLVQSENLCHAAAKSRFETLCFACFVCADPFRWIFCALARRQVFDRDSKGNSGSDDRVASDLRSAQVSARFRDQGPLNYSHRFDFDCGVRIPWKDVLHIAISTLCRLSTLLDFLHLECT